MKHGKNNFEKIMAGMEDALAYADGDVSKGTAHKWKWLQSSMSTNDTKRHEQKTLCNPDG